MKKPIKLEFDTIYRISKKLLEKADVADRYDYPEDAADLILRIDRISNLYEKYVMRCSHIKNKDQLIEESQKAMHEIFESEIYTDIAREVYSS